MTLMKSSTYKGIMDDCAQSNLGDGSVRPPAKSGKFLNAEQHRRFWSRVTILDPESCWNWDRSIHKFGYGQMRLNGKLDCTHRIAYKDCNGEIPAGMVVRHRCDNPRCVNPGHLLIGTQKDNMRDAIERGRHDMGRSKAREWLRIVAEVKAKRESEL